MRGLRSSFLIVSFSDDCSSCVAQELSVIQEKGIMEDCTFLLVNANKRNARLWANANGIPVNRVLVSESSKCNGLADANGPIVFYISDQGLIKHVFMPKLGLPDLSVNFYATAK